MNRERVQSKEWMQTTVANSTNQGILTDYDIGGVPPGEVSKRLISLMKKVMLRNGSKNWTEELKEFYELAEKDNGQTEIQQGGGGTVC